MSPLGIKRLVAAILIVSPWIFIPGLFKDAVFIVLGILLYISTLDLRKKSVRTLDKEENESMPRDSMNGYERNGSTPVNYQSSIA